MPDVLTVDETAGVLRLGRNTVYEAIREGRLPSIRIRRRILIPKSALRQWLDGGGTRPEEVPAAGPLRKA
jgi:excisionase family DNA binding protein